MIKWVCISTYAHKFNSNIGPPKRVAAIASFGSMQWCHVGAGAKTD